MNPLRVLNLSSGDLVGSRFNGFDWKAGFESHEVISKMVVHWNHRSEYEWVEPLSTRWSQGILRESARAIRAGSLFLGDERNRYPWSKKILRHPWFVEADVIHLQIVHDGMLDLDTIKEIIKRKPVVWTWHDPWPLTGHCIYPMTCQRFQLGCGDCPDLSRPFSVKFDRTIRNRQEKQKLISKNFITHVATEWFKNFIVESIGEDALDIELLPFGLSNQNMLTVEKGEARKKLDIPIDMKVIGIRATPEPQKNFQLFQHALEKMSPDPNLVIVTIQDSGYLTKFQGKFEIRELGWTDDSETLNLFYSALDVFVTPSTYETFGFMSIEAMARGVPVVALKGTAIDEICNLAENGFPAESSTVRSFQAAIETAVYDDKQRIEKSAASHLHVTRNYDLDKFLIGLKELYLRAVEKYNSEGI